MAHARSPHSNAPLTVEGRRRMVRCVVDGGWSVIALIDASGQQPVLGSPKSAASERTIPLPQIVISAFERHLAEYPPPGTTVWTTEAGGFLRRGTIWEDMA